MKIAFFGTPEFAGEILSGILSLNPSPREGSKTDHIEIALAVSQPDKPVGRKRELVATPVKQVGLDAGIEVLQPEKIKKNTDFHEYLKSLDLDFIVVVAYGKIIPQAILDIPKHGCINIHGSILPQYRGASPVQAAVKAGDTVTGLTTMYMSAGMDEGDILKIGKVTIDNIDTSVDIFKKFVHIGPELLVETLHEIISGNLKGVAQNHEEASHCGKISREDGEVSFEKQSRDEIYNIYRAYTPWPGIYTWYEGKRLVLEEVSLYITPLPNPLQTTSSQPSPLGEKELATGLTGSAGLLSSKGEEIQRGGGIGELIKISKNTYGIICRDKKILEITRVKLEGKKSMDVTSFVNGNREVVGYTFR